MSHTCPRSRKSVVSDEYDPIQILTVRDKKHFREIVSELAKKICIEGSCAKALR